MLGLRMHIVRNFLWRCPRPHSRGLQCLPPKKPQLVWAVLHEDYHSAAGYAPADDMVVYGETEVEHDKNLHTLKRRCEEKGLKLYINPTKLRIKEPKMKFAGVICSKDGV